MFVNVAKLSKREEPLLSRTKVYASIEFEKGTPSYSEAISMLTSHLKADEKLIAIRHIYNEFGTKKAEVIAYLYKDENSKHDIEPKVKGKKEEKKQKEKKKQKKYFKEEKKVIFSSVQKRSRTMSIMSQKHMEILQIFQS